MTTATTTRFRCHDCGRPSSNKQTVQLGRCLRCRLVARGLPLCVWCDSRRAIGLYGLCKGCSTDPAARAHVGLHRVDCSACGLQLADNPRRRDASGICNTCRLGRTPESVLEANRLLREGVVTDTGPTTAAPGTAEKLAVLCLRTEARVGLFDGRDA